MKPYIKIADEQDAIRLATNLRKEDEDEIKAYGASNHVLYDVKCILSQSEVDGRL